MLCGFEPGEPAAVSAGKKGGIEVAYDGTFATSGTGTLRIVAEGWKRGDSEWPWLNLKHGLEDWRGYDRLVIDLVNAAPGGDGVSVSAKGCFSARTELPAFGSVRWVVPLKWHEPGKKFVGTGPEKTSF